MSEDILNPSYWRRRLETADHLHHAVFRCPRDEWERIAEVHRGILADRIGPTDSVLDAGCAWGRMLDLLPRDWRGLYLGVDLAPAFIETARRTYPRRAFIVSDLRNLRETPDRAFDWAVMISIRPMVRRNLGGDEWAKMESELRRVARRLLFLEYDVDDPGEVIECSGPETRSETAECASSEGPDSSEASS